MKRLEGKVAIIAGAGRGIGRATAKLFAAEGAKVAVLSLTPANVDAVVADIEAGGGIALGVPTDVGDAGQIKAAIDKVAATWGGVDILVNNAFDPSVVQSSVLDLSVEQDSVHGRGGNSLIVLVVACAKEVVIGLVG